MLSIGEKITFFDGGMGSEIERLGLSYEYPEELNITSPKAIQGIHQAYASAGADFITANTFGLNRIKYKGKHSLPSLCIAAVENAKSAGKPVFFDMGPTGALLKPIGTLSFDEAYDAFAEMVKLSRDSVDGYILETFSDIYELKAAILAVKENCDKPIFATMTFDKTHRTLTGTSPEIMVSVLEGLGVDALGANCSLGPAELYEIAEKILNFAHVPVIMQPNLGLPVLKNGKTEYALTPENFAEAVKKYADIGVSIIGGCCGTTPECIKMLSELGHILVRRPKNTFVTAVSSSTRIVKIEDVTVCGERLNPTGKKKIKEAITEKNYDFLVSEAIKEQDAGCDLLDVNVGVPKIDESAVMREVCEKIQEYVDLPLQIDSSNPEAIEAGARYYNGIPLINSVNGEKKVMDAIFPIAKKYGAVVLGLTLDENGIPKTAEERAKIAERIISEAAAYGIPKHKIMIDTLVLTASAEQDLVRETLGALPLVRKMGVKTALGVSNVSFGLPNRALLNRTFLSLAMQAGLTMPILNPLDAEMMGAVDAFRVLYGIDRRSEKYIERHSEASVPPATDTAPERSLFDAVKRGLSGEVSRLTLSETSKIEPLQIVNEILIPALSEVGDAYSAGKLFLPQLIASAEAAKAAFDVITEYMPARAIEKEYVILATVKGDIHDIGKNIVKTVLRSYGYHIIDLGRDVEIEKITDAYKKYKPLAIGLSALMTTTVVNMEKTIKALHKIGCTSHIFVGGAVVTAETAKEIGADFYTKDALEFVNVLEDLH